MAIDVTVLRVFTDADGKFGNPLGVVDASTVAPADRQRIATELGYSETIFIDVPETGANTAHARIFTPATELPFAGHPTVGASWWLRDIGRPVHTLAVPAGVVQVSYDGDVTASEPAPSGRRSSRSTTSSPPTNSSPRTPDDYPDDVENYLWTWTDRDKGEIRSRMFAVGLGVPEDEATGAAAVRITDYLSRDLTIVQGKGSVIETQWSRRRLGAGRGPGGQTTGPGRSTDPRGGQPEAGNPAVRAQRLDLAFEIVRRGERPVHGRESQIGDLVEIAQRTKDRQTHLVAGHFRLNPWRARRLRPAAPAGSGRRRRPVAPLAGPAHSLDHLLAAERLGDAAALDDREHGGLHGGEPATTLRARPATPNRLTLVGFSGVDDPGIGVAAERTVHDCSFAAPTIPRKRVGPQLAWGVPPINLERLRAYLCAPLDNRQSA